MPFVGSTKASTGSATSLDLTIPATAQDGDVAWLFVTCKVGDKVPPTGWTQREQSTATSHVLTRYTRKLVTGDAGDAVTVGGGGNEKWGAILFVLRGINGATPEAPTTPASAVGDMTAATAMPGTTTTAASDQIAVISGRYGNGTGATDFTPPDGWTEDEEWFNTGGGSTASGSAHREAVPAGAVAGSWTVGDPNGTAITSVVVANMAPVTSTVTVTNPGAQAVTTGESVSLQMTGSSTAGGALTWTATGLPTGLTITSSGLITGTPPTVQSTTCTVTAKDSTGATGTANFTWTVTAGDATDPANAFFKEAFENGTDGATITTETTTFDEYQGTVTFTATAAHGSLGGKIDAGASGAISSVHLNDDSTTRDKLYLRFYARFPDVTQQVYISNVYGDGGGVGGQLRLNAGGTFTIRDKWNAVATSAQPINANQWYRIEWGFDHTAQTQELRVYQYDSDTALFTISGGYTQPQMTEVQVGTVDFAPANWVMYVDDFAMSETGWVGSAVPPADTYTRYLWDGGAWVPCDTSILPRVPYESGGGFGLEPFGTTPFGGTP